MNGEILRSPIFLQFEDEISNIFFEQSEFEKNVGCLVVLRIYVILAVFQPYRDLEAGDIQVARRGIEPCTSCSARA